MGEGHGFFGGGYMGFFWILVIVAVIWAVLAAARSGGPQDSRRDKSALEILRERYARGEIDQQEFEQKRKDLGG